MTKNEQLVLTVMDGLQDAKRDWRVFKDDAMKAEGANLKGGRKKMNGPRPRKYVLESMDSAQRRVRLAGSEARSEGMWMRTTLASLAENWKLQVCRGRTRFQEVSWKDAFAEFGGAEPAELKGSA